MNPNESDTDKKAGDLLFGAAAIGAFLIELGWPETVDPYYERKKFAQTGRGPPIGNRRRWRQPDRQQARARPSRAEDRQPHQSTEDRRSLRQPTPGAMSASHWS